MFVTVEQRNKKKVYRGGESGVCVTVCKRASERASERKRERREKREPKFSRHPKYSHGSVQREGESEFEEKRRGASQWREEIHGENGVG